MWQDLLVAAGSSFFCLGLVPACLSTQRPPVLTSSMMAGGLLLVTTGLLGSSLYVSALLSGIQMCLWTYLALTKGTVNEHSH